MSGVGDVLAKMLHTRLDNDKVFGRCKNFLKEMNGLASSVECIAEEKKKLIAIVAESAKVIIDLLAQLKESESKMKEFELEAAKEKEVNKELEKELLAFKKEAMEQHENGFYKAIR